MYVQWMDVQNLVTVHQAAIRQHGVLFTMPRPFRHADIIRAMVLAGVPPPISGGQGFLLSNGAFATRKAAKLVAYRAAQITEARMEQGRVFCTEDLW